MPLDCLGTLDIETLVSNAGFCPGGPSCALVDGQTVTMNALRYNLKLVKNGSGQVFMPGLSLDVPRDLSDTSRMVYQWVCTWVKL